MKSNKQAISFWVRKRRNIEDMVTGNAYIEMEFPKSGGRKGKAVIPREDADNRDYLVKLLKQKNAVLPADKTTLFKAVSDFIESEPERNILRLPHVGWQSGGRRFVVGQRVIGEGGAKLIRKAPIWIKDNTASRLKAKGNLQEWKHQVARIAKYSSVLRVVILAAFAAPLIKVVEFQNFLIVVFGPSKAGKTTLILALNSVAGGGDETSLPNFYATQLSLSEKARGYNDIAFPINEIGLLAGGKKLAYEGLRNLTYTWAEGRDKERHSSVSVATPQGSHRFRSIGVLTGEHSVEELATLAGASRDAGEYARAIDLPAVRGYNPTIFDRFPEKVPQSRHRDWARKRLSRLRKACEAQHGTAIRPYVEHLIRIGDGLRGRVETHIDEFVSNLDELELEPALEHAARNFGLLYAAAALAIDAEILPWDLDDAREDVRRCFKAAVGALRAGEDRLKLGKEKLREFLNSPKIIAKSRNRRFGPDEAHGYTEEDDGRVRYVVHSATLRRHFGNALQLAKVLRWLKDEDLLVRGAARKRGGGTAEWAETSPRWPNGTSQKSIVFWDPLPKLKQP